MKLADLVAMDANRKRKTVAVAAAEDQTVIDAITDAVDRNLASFQLYGNETIITQLLEERLEKHPALGDAVKVIGTNSHVVSAIEAVKAVSTGKADVLMKGHVPTATLLKEVLNKEYGLKSDGVLSHVAVFEIPGREQLLLLTDAAMNIAPDLMTKVQITNNAVSVAKSIGVEMPKVAALAAVETVNQAMQATVDAALLTQMNARGQIKGCVVDGPLAFDNAVSADAATRKGLAGNVAGNADILLVPAIETGNALYKSFIYFARAKVGAVIAGAKAPIVLTSRSDSSESKYYSLALAVCFAKGKNNI